ncbi:MAG: pilin [Clostridia bacterium]|nr:pilin [Clostridia bacterium]
MNFLSKLAPMGDTATATATDTTFSTSDLTKIINNVTTVISTVLGLLTVGVVILTVMIAYKFFTASDKDKRANAKAQLIYAIIGIIVLIALLIFAPTITKAVTDSIDGSKTFISLF